MKKIVLSLAGVLAATAFAPEAAAVPSFARQTGMACNSCHFQSYPALTSFGRAFKSGGYTMIGAQTKVEGEHGLSLPGTLNASLYTQMRYNKTNGVKNANTNTKGSKNSGRFDMPDEMALFLAGRGSENIGFVAEVQLAGALGGTTPALTAGAVAAATTAGLAAGNVTGPVGLVPNFKMAFVFDAGSVKISAIPFWSNAGASGGFDLFATGSYGPGRVVENGMGYSATMYMGATNNPATTAGYATGLALVVSNDQFHINLSPYAGTSPTANWADNNTTSKLGATYLRAGWTPSYNNWDLGIGLQNWSGKATKGTAMNDQESRLTVIDAQAQGEVSGMPLGIYTSYGTAPASAAVLTATGGGSNVYNNGTNRKTAFGLLADLWVMPGTLGIQAGFMRAKTGMNRLGVVGAGSESDNSYTLGARYKIRQNVKAGIAYTKFTGNAYDAGGSGGTNADDTINTMNVAPGGTSMARVNGRGNSRLTLILSAGF